MATLGELVTQIQRGAAAEFLPAPPGGGSGSGGGSVTVSAPSTATGSTGTTAASTASSGIINSIINSILNWMVQPGSPTGSFLLRLLLFVLGLICIIGAIYLYKGSNPILEIPGKLAHGAVKAGSAALKAASQGEE
jgi:hypothetical protein